jgi:chromosome segregation ATPase
MNIDLVTVLITIAAAAAGWLLKTLPTAGYSVGSKVSALEAELDVLRAELKSLKASLEKHENMADKVFDKLNGWKGVVIGKLEQQEITLAKQEVLFTKMLERMTHTQTEVLELRSRCVANHTNLDRITTPPTRGGPHGA